MKTIAFILAFFASSVFAQDAFVEIIKSEDGHTIVHGKNIKKTATGAEIVLQWTDRKSISFDIASISAQTCKQGYGEVAYFTLARKPMSKSDFVANGQNINSAIGDWLCLFIELSKPTKGKNL
jgi:hypothetical protein